MEWNSLFDKSEWLFRQILNREEKVPHEDSRLKDIAQKLSDSQYLHKKIEEQERFDYLKAYHKNIVPPKKNNYTFLSQGCLYSFAFNRLGYALVYLAKTVSPPIL